MSNEITKIIVLTTGGTIEKIYDEGDGTLHNQETFIKSKIESKLRLPYTSIDVKSLMAKDSLDMDDADRQLIQEAIALFSKLGNPIVVLHGTDRMQQSAEFVQKTLKDLKVPVIFTGAMKPLGFEDSDAMQNVIEALFAVKIIGPGVYISFHNRLFTVPGARKNKEKSTFEA